MCTPAAIERRKDQIKWFKRDKILPNKFILNNLQIHKTHQDGKHIMTVLLQILSDMCSFI